MLEVLGQDYVRTARAKGLAWWGVVVRHALKNALIPIITIFGLQFGNLLAGAVIVETVFSRPGLGRLIVGGILAKDFPLVQGTVLFVAASYVIINVLVVVAYPFADRPRLRLLRRPTRRGADAGDRRVAGVPGHPARAGDRERADTGPGQRDDRRRARRGADLRAPGACQRALGTRAGLRRGRAGDRRSRPHDPDPLHPAQRRRAAHRDGDARSRHRDPVSRRPELPRARQSAADRGVGTDARRGARFSAGGMVDLDLPPSRHHAD